MADEITRSRAISWLQDGCKPKGAQFAAIMSAIFFKQDGQLITRAETAPDGSVVLTLSSGEALTIEKFKLKRLGLSDIAGLTDALAQCVHKVDGKQLSTHDFSDAYKQKLEGLSNYQKPAGEPIGYIGGLQQALDDKVSTEQLEQGLATKPDIESLGAYARADAANLSADQLEAWRMRLDSFNGEIPVVSDRESITLSPEKPHVCYTGSFAEPVVVIAFDPAAPNAQVKHIIHNQSERMLSIQVGDGLRIDGQAEKQLAPHTGTLISPETAADGRIVGFGSWGPNSEQWLRLDASNTSPELDAYFQSLLDADTTADDMRITGFTTPLLAQNSTQTLILCGTGLRTKRALSFVICGEGGRALDSDLIRVVRWDTSDSSQKLYVTLSAGSTPQDQVKATVKLLVNNKPVAGSAALCLFKESALTTIPPEAWKTYTERDAAAYDIAVTADGIDYKGGQTADFQVAATAPDIAFSAAADYWISVELQVPQRRGQSFALSFGLTPGEGYTPNGCYLDMRLGVTLSADSSEAHITPLYNGHPEQSICIPYDFPVPVQILKTGSEFSLHIPNADGDPHRFEKHVDVSQSEVLTPKVCFRNPGSLSHISILRF
ncbi:MAG: hypothetical protein V6Z82_04140 [Flavobacteriales bacterium]